LRLFVAIEIPDNIRGALAAFLKEMQGVAPQAKWVRAENLHVTLKFLGETEATKVRAVKDGLEGIHSDGRVTLDFRGLGFFPNEKRPRVFWAGMEASANLKTLAQDIEEAMHRLGFPPEERPFAPHLTLARFNPPGLPPKLAREVKENSSREFGNFSTREFHLIESKLKPSGAEYTTLQSFSFFAEK
jgi:2'-5' RNA ligase